MHFIYEEVCRIHCIFNESKDLDLESLSPVSERRTCLVFAFHVGFGTTWDYQLISSAAGTRNFIATTIELELLKSFSCLR